MRLSVTSGLFGLSGAIRSDDIDLLSANATALSSQLQSIASEALDGWAWQSLHPQVDDEFKGVSMDAMLKSMGDALPPTVMAALRDEAGVDPSKLSEKQLNHARTVINGMMEGQVTSLDVTVVQCKESREKLTQNENMVAADLSRLGSKLAKEKQRILQAQAGIEEAQAAIMNSQTQLRENQKTCKRTVGNLQAQLALIKKDLDAAEMVVKLTTCKKSFLQTANATEAEVQACVSGDEAVVTSGDHDVTLDSPTAAAAFHTAFEASVDDESFVQASPTGGKVRHYTRAKQAGRCSALDSAGKAVKGCEVFATEQAAAGTIASAAACASKCSANVLCQSFRFRAATGTETSGECTLQFADCDETANKACFLSTGGATAFTTYNKGAPPLAVGDQVIPSVQSARKNPPAAKQAFKCTVAKPDCGLLNDNMSIFWGEVKDKYDAKFTELVVAKTACTKTEGTINEEIALWNALLQERNVELGEATSQQSSATQTQVDKQREQRELKRQYKSADTKCKTLVGETMMNLCGLRKVRNELAKFSKGSMKPEKIFDCVVTDWSPQECSKSCVSGRQVLVRSVSQQPSLGIKCPPLQMVKKCNEFPCAVDCKMGSWSGWGRCSKECGGGLQSRVRAISKRPNFGGQACPPQTETQQCNVQSCDADCKLSKWTQWKPCNRACGGGTQKRVKSVSKPARGNGKCAKALHKSRYARRKCNTQSCPPDPVCNSKMDVVFVIDSSGSWTEKGYKVVVEFMKGLAQKYKMDSKSVKMGIVEFSKEAHVIQGMTFNQPEIATALNTKLKFRKGLTDMAKGLLAADKLLLDGRKDAQSEVIVITDGKPSFKFASGNAAKKLRRSGARLIFMPVRTYGQSPFLASWASHPGKENVFRVKRGLAELKSKMTAWQNKMVISTCPSIYSPLLAKLSKAGAR
mmetsp:Transcript_42262/g.92189  ORF Transcript_42262/g.92189 Transcript_42262/m.92189 type:complete len:921 (-) Transcript_42262:241-3003(-)